VVVVILALDPSINDIGCAIVDQQGMFLTGTTLKTKGENSVHKLASLVELFGAWFGQQKGIEVIVIEHTRFFARQKNQSHASAQKLNLAKGVLYGCAKMLHPGAVHLIWVPGFNKEQSKLMARAYKLPDKTSQHVMDAFWLAQQWSLASEPQRQQWLTVSLD
jgi:hypothetical protein